MVSLGIVPAMKHFISILLFSLLVMGGGDACAQRIVWQTSGIGMATSSNSEYMNYSFATTPNFKNMNITSDGQGGVIMCWMANVAGYYTIYAQRADATGKLVWSTSAGGVQVALPTGGYTFSYQYMPSCVGDGSGGAYVSWSGYDYVNGTYHPFIQHMSAAGVPLWGESGVVLAPITDKATTNYPYIPQLDNDGNGGVWVTWYSYPGTTTNTTYGTVYVARMSGAGTAPVYAYGGPLSVQSMSSAEYLALTCNPVLCSDADGNAYLAYHTFGSGMYRNHIAKITASTGAVAFNTIATNSTYPTYGYQGYNIAPDGHGGAILHFLQYYDSLSYFYMMMGARVNNTGAVAWGPKLTHQPSEYYQYPGGKIAGDGDGGAYFLRYDNWNYYTPALQHMSADGRMLWNPTDYPSGISIANNDYNYVQNAQVISDPFGNPITVYAYGNTISLQKWDKTTGLEYAGWPGSQMKFGRGTNPQLAPDGVGGAFIGWNQTSSGYDIYVQHIADTVMAPRAALLSAPAIAVGPVRVGGNATASGIVIANTAGPNAAMQFPLTIYGVSSTSGLCTLAGNTLPLHIAVGDSLSLTVRVAPKQNGPFTDTLVVSTNDPLRPRTRVVISGVGIFPHLLGNDTLQMPSTRAGGATTASRAYAVSNSGTDTLHITNVAVTGADAGSFSLTGSTAQTLAPGAAGTITVVFAPTTAAAKSATVQIFSDDSVSPKTVRVAGTGIYPHPVFPATLQFPSTVFDIRTTVRGLIVTNSGAEPLVLRSSTISGANAADFSLTTPLPDTIAPRATSELRIQFAPKTTQGARTATLNLASNFDSAQAVFGTPSLQVQLAGMSIDGAPEPQFAQQIVCGQLHVGTIDTVTFRITNLLSASKKLIVVNYALKGIDAASYTILNAPKVPDTIAIGAYRDLRIRFAASRMGMLPASLEITSNAAISSLSVPLIGAGIKGILRGEDVDVGPVGVRACADALLHIKNDGTDTLVIRSFALNGPSATVFSAVGNTLLRLAPDSGAAITIRYCPLVRQSDTVEGVFVSGDGDTLSLQIVGSGVNSGVLTGATAMDFGLVGLQQGVTRELTLTNAGEIPVTILSAQFVNATLPLSFATDLTWPVTVRPGESISMGVSFMTNTGGNKSATLVFTTEHAAFSVALSGRATPDPFVLDPYQIFDTTLITGTAAVERIHMANFTKKPRGVISLALTGPGANVYSILYPLWWPYSMAGLSTDSITIGFRPFFPGPYFATLTIVLAPSSPSSTVNDTFRIALSGQAKLRSGIDAPAVEPGAIDLEQNYPNPFSGVTALRYHTTGRAAVSLVLYDLLGREVRSIDRGMREAGVHDVSLDADGLVDGLYLCELRAQGSVRRRLVMVQH